MYGSVIEATFRLELTERLPVLSVSDGIEALLGYKAEDFLSSRVSLRERIHKDDGEIAARLFSPEVEEQSGGFNLRIRHSDGRIRCIRGHFTKEKSAGGEAVLELLLQDAKSLWRSGSEGMISPSFRAMLDNTDDYIFFKDSNFVTTAVSKSLEAASVFTLEYGESVVGLTDYDTYAEEYADDFYRCDQQILAGSSSTHIVQEMVTDRGVKVWLDDCKHPLKNEAGEVIGLFGMSRNITEHMLAKESLRDAQRIAGLGSYDLDIPSGIWTSSEVLDGIFGIDHEFARTVEGWTALIDPRDRAMMEAYFANEVVGKGVAFDKEYRIIRQTDGAVRWVHGLGRLEFNADGRPVKMRGTIQEITERRKAEEQLRLAASVFTHTREGIMITAADGLILDVNSAFTRITGYERKEVLGRNPRMLKSGRQSGEFYAEMWRALTEKGDWSGELWNRDKAGRDYAQLLTISAVRDAAGGVQQYVALFSDITSIKEHESRLEEIAHFDMLTGLPNRVLLSDRLHQAMAQAHRRKQLMGVAYLDMDGFKAVNDQHGHHVGDELLKALASRMKLALREGDTLARLGGDEFVALLHDLSDVEDAAPALERLLAAASEAAQIGDAMLQVSVSIGVAFYPNVEGMEADQLLRQADQAMYQAKLAGGNRYHIFDSRHDRSVRGHHEELERIRQALAAKEFVLYYQPRVRMNTGQVVGAEALIRWQHPERGLLLPEAFLPIIEDHPLAIDLGEWVIDSVLTQMEEWRAAGLDIPVSINIGSRQLQQTIFVERLAVLLAAHPHVKPSSVELEILETSALRDMAQISQMMSGCREIGVSFSLDDFGTGYSSLAYLKQLPANILKIDKCFVRDIVDDPEDLAILEGVLGLAAAFRREVIAEGVETAEHGAILLWMGCELAQGYFIARPMPAEKMQDWIATWRPDPCWVEATAISDENRPLLYAYVEHRSWIASIGAFLREERHLPPRMEADACRLSAWLAAQRQSVQGERPAFHALDQLHRQLHEMAAEILTLKAQGRNSEGLARLCELHGLRDRLLEELKAF